MLKSKELGGRAKTVWITGASMGIGRATAIEALRRGYVVIVSARGQEGLDRLRNEVVALRNDMASRILVAPCDVTKPEELREVFCQKISNTYGGLDILIANAGTHIRQEPGSFNLATFRSLFELNFFGVLNCIDAVLPSMIERGAGQIVGVSSVAGYRALPTAAAYGSSKAALTHALESLRFDLEPHGIGVTVVSPGFVRTPLTDKNEFSMPFIVEPEVAARRIMDGVEKRAYEVHFPRRFTYSLKLLQLLPAACYHRLIVWSTGQGKVKRSRKSEARER